VEVSISVERLLAERIKRTWINAQPGRTSDAPLYRNGVPVLNGTKLLDIDWYHTLDLGNGIVTPGFVDHREQVAQHQFPASLAGKRCLDVATFDGFWAFEMEKRGAAEVIAIDLYSRADCDYPTNWAKEELTPNSRTLTGTGFAYAKRALKSNVQRKVLSVYELSPDVLGTFDFVFMSDLLLHLRDPLRALESVWSVTRGEALIAECYDAALETTGEQGAIRFVMNADDYSGCHWWLPSVSALRAMMVVARFQDIEEVTRFDLHAGNGTILPKVVFRARHVRRQER
jgi:tRNA (mo5U34)-methyltransferase